MSVDLRDDLAILLKIMQKNKETGISNTDDLIRDLMKCRGYTEEFFDRVSTEFSELGVSEQ